MCTVTFVPFASGAILTSNRDEDTARAAVVPQMAQGSGHDIWFPKDPKAGGSWFAASSKPAVVILLNGAAEKHEWRPPYRKSRGLILLELVGSTAVLPAWDAIDLHDIEPFTLVVFESGQLSQLRWDGHAKSHEPRDASKTHIWSSATLYPEPVRQARALWFAQFLEKHPNPIPSDLFQFHSGTHLEDRENGLVMERYGFLKTLSITQAVLLEDLQLRHYDLVGAQQFSQTFLSVRL